jgi:hypothetical protein
MKIAYVSTYLPQQGGIATYTDYLIHGLKEVNPALEIKVVAEKGAAPVKQERFEIVPNRFIPNEDIPFEDKEFEHYVLDRTERYRRAISWPVIASQHMELYRGA